MKLSTEVAVKEVTVGVVVNVVVVTEGEGIAPSLEPSSGRAGRAGTGRVMANEERAVVGTVTTASGRTVAKELATAGCLLRGHHPFLTETCLSPKWKSV